MYSSANGLLSVHLAIWIWPHAFMLLFDVLPTRLSLARDLLAARAEPHR